MMKYEVETVWQNGKVKNYEKVKTLLNRYKPRDDGRIIRNIKFSDEDLRDDVNNNEIEVPQYDDVQLSENAKAALRMSPKFMRGCGIAQLTLRNPTCSKCPTWVGIGL